MLIDLSQGGDVASNSRAVDQQGANPGRAGAGGVLLERVADVQRLLWTAAGDLERGCEDRRIGLAGTGRRRAHSPVEEPAEPAALQHPGKRAVPVGDGDQPLASVPQTAQGRNGVRIALEPDRLEQLV